jgi:hypothetical protein
VSKPGAEGCRKPVLRAVRDEVGEPFVAGIVFHAGPHVFPLGDRLVAAPVSALWT